LLSAVRVSLSSRQCNPPCSTRPAGWGPHGRDSSSPQGRGALPLRAAAPTMGRASENRAGAALGPLWRHLTRRGSCAGTGRGGDAGVTHGKSPGPQCPARPAQETTSSGRTRRDRARGAVRAESMRADDPGGPGVGRRPLPQGAGAERRELGRDSPLPPARAARGPLVQALPSTAAAVLCPRGRSEPGSDAATGLAAGAAVLAGQGCSANTRGSVRGSQRRSGYGHSGLSFRVGCRRVHPLCRAHAFSLEC